MGLFDGLFQGAAGGVASLVGGVLTNNANKDIAQQASQFSAQQAQNQMDFQERMRATQYQTTVDDLNKAGLNPMLAVSQGGAGTPSGAAAVGQQATLRNPAEGLASSAATMANIKADLELKDTAATKNIADTKSAEKNAQYTDALTASEIMRMPGIPESIKKTQAEILNIQAQTELNSSYRHAQDMNTLIRSSGDLPEAKSKGKYYENAPYNPFALRDVSQAGSSAANIAKSINPFKLGR